MRIKFISLALQWKKDREVLDLNHHILFFHGQISSGKSTIARLIDFCLGGFLEMTTALQQEFISAGLTAKIGEYEVLLERSSGSENVQVTWKGADEKIATVQAPIQSRKIPIWNGEIENLSDLLFYLLNIEPLRVKRSKLNEESPMIRLSFRDFVWYSYLEQEHMDSSFYKLEDPMRGNKSKDVMRFVFGYYSEKLSKLETQLERTKEERIRKLSTAAELLNFLKRFGYGTTEGIESQIAAINEELMKSKEKRQELEKGYKADTHNSDTLRDKIRKLIQPLEEHEQIVVDLRERIDEQNALRSELLSSKFKLARVETASNVLGNVKFEMCPACGNALQKKEEGEKHNCYLCGNTTKQEEQVPQAEEMRLDLDGRISDLEKSVAQHVKALDAQGKKLQNLREEKKKLDAQLQNELRNYDSAFLSQFREVDRDIATMEERLNGFEKIKLMPEEIKKLEKNADALAGEEQKLKREIETEKGSLTKAADYVHELEETFMATLVSIKLPGVSSGDAVKINMKSWEVQIWHQGESAFPWNFYNAGSGGVKTLFNVCYLLSIHLVAERNNLPLPAFIMIDTPMQNIGENVNKELFENFYNYLYDIAEGALKDTQFIIIDKDFVKPQSKDVDIYERYMTPDHDESPPLIRYFRLNKNPESPKT